MWTADVADAADALRFAARHLDRATIEAQQADDPARAAVQIEQAEGEMERAQTFMQRARRAVQHAG